MSANDVGVGTSNHNEHGMKTLRPITCGKFLVPPAPRTAVSASLPHSLLPSVEGAMYCPAGEAPFDGQCVEW